MPAGPGVRRRRCVCCSAGGEVHIRPRYRQFPELTRAQVIRSELLSGFMWFWIFWHFWHSSDAVLVRPPLLGAGGGRGPGPCPGSDRASLPGPLPLPRPFGLDGRGAGDPSGRRGIGAAGRGTPVRRLPPLLARTRRPPGAAAGLGFVLKGSKCSHRSSRSLEHALSFASKLPAVIRR